MYQQVPTTPDDMYHRTADACASIAPDTLAAQRLLSQWWHVPRCVSMPMAITLNTFIKGPTVSDVCSRVKLDFFFRRYSFVLSLRVQHSTILLIVVGRSSTAVSNVMGSHLKKRLSNCCQCVWCYGSTRICNPVFHVVLCRWNLLVHCIVQMLPEAFNCGIKHDGFPF